MCLYTALSMSFPFQCPAFPPGCKGQPPEPVLRGFHTTGPEPIHVPGSHTTLPGCGRWSWLPTECVSTPSPREPSATLHNGRKMPMEGFGVFQVRDKEECKRSVLEAIKAGYPVFEHRNLANICETTVLACCIPAFLDKLKNPAYTYNVGRAFWKGRCPFTGSSHLFQEQEVSPDSPSLIKAKLILPAQFLHQVHGESLATAWMFHEP